jgi:Na+-driven multidrug efflux pump
MPIAAMVMMGPTYMTAVGKFKIAMFLSLMRPLVVMIPALLILPKFLGLSGVWYANPLADVVAFVIVVTVMILEFKRYKR